ncbi:MAG: DNA translocase FtsK [Pseudomonadota bacterium]
MSHGGVAARADNGPDALHRASHAGPANNLVSPSPNGLAAPSLLELLEPAANSAARAQVPANVIKAQATLLEQALHTFGVRCRLTVAQSGPVITRYAAHCDKRINIARVMALVDEVTEASGVASLRIVPVAEAPSSGARSGDGNLPAFGIEVVNAAPEPLLHTRTLHAFKPFQHPALQLPVALGLDIALQPQRLDLADRALVACIAPAASAGVVLQNLLLGIVLRCAPEDVQVVCIDPGLATLDAFSGVPHVYGAPLHTPEQMSDALHGVVAEVRARRQIMTQARASSLRALNNQIRHAQARGMPLKRRVRIGFDPVTRQPLEQELLLATEPYPRVVVIIAGLDRVANAARAQLRDALALIQELGAQTGVHLAVGAPPELDDAELRNRLAGAQTLLVGQVPAARYSQTWLGFAGAERLLPVGDFIVRDPALRTPNDAQRPAHRRRYMGPEQAPKKADFASAFDPRLLLPIPSAAELARVCDALSHPVSDVA